MRESSAARVNITGTCAREAIETPSKLCAPSAPTRAWRSATNWLGELASDEAAVVRVGAGGREMPAAFGIVRRNQTQCLEHRGFSSAGARVERSLLAGGAFAIRVLGSRAEGASGELAPEQPVAQLRRRHDGLLDQLEAQPLIVGHVGLRLGPQQAYLVLARAHRGQRRAERLAAVSSALLCRLHPQAPEVGEALVPQRPHARFTPCLVRQAAPAGAPAQRQEDAQ